MVLSTSKNAAAFGSAGTASAASTSAAAADAAPARTALDPSWVLRRSKGIGSTLSSRREKRGAPGVSRGLLVVLGGANSDLAARHPTTHQRRTDEEHEGRTSR